jgi:NhaA family Na+:H+ antiporter
VCREVWSASAAACPEGAQISQNRPRGRLSARGSWPEAGRVADILRQETVGGALLLVATAAALVWANSPASDGYFALRDTRAGPAALHLDLTIGAWAADGLLAIFFFVAGLELKREFVAGDLRDPRRAVLSPSPSSRSSTPGSCRPAGCWRPWCRWGCSPGSSGAA